MYLSPAFRLVGIGFYLVVSILLPLSLGIWIDGKLNSEPFFTILMLIFGLVFGFVGVYRQLKEVTKN
ncbi:MAG: AtpZ/AtpI family protein [Dehalococcoidia bacterium]